MKENNIISLSGQNIFVISLNMCFPSIEASWNNICCPLVLVQCVSDEGYQLLSLQMKLKLCFYFF